MLAVVGRLAERLAVVEPEEINQSVNFIRPLLYHYNLYINRMFIRAETKLVHWPEIIITYSNNPQFYTSFMST